MYSFKTRLIRSGLLLLVIPLFAFSIMHKFYVSVTNIQYSEKDNSLQITSRIFIDDLENALEERYGVEMNLATEKESDEANFYIEKYMRSKLVISADGTNKAFVFLGKKYDNDLVICYLEIEDIDLPEHKTLAVENDILTDMFDEQQNIVHFKINGKKKSFILVKENNKGMLNL
ncbi:DUF6702 family protein [Eudoraea adriatica]|uniref:DUF6702 family protein n=1 Tax=Eudoraea adriatica TaxID=446681 RepID=UPI00037FACEF|nr:DUF6702 family protein [Eudoraea adriatica]